MSAPNNNLQRVLGVPGATLMGLGSILGTGVFVSIGIAHGIAGQWVILATILAALVACANALSSAQLAAAHPVAGGTYEYGYRLLNPLAGFSAGWLFLVAKSASAATAALGVVVYAGGDEAAPLARWLALALVVVMVVVVLAGLRRSNWVNTSIVAVTLLSLVAFIVVSLAYDGAEAATTTVTPGKGPSGLAEATALMFVAFTGYGRIATMGEEVREPRGTIPRAIMSTVAVSALLYVGVAWGLSRVLATAPGAAPLEEAARMLNMTWLEGLIVLGAVTAMLGVLLNLVLGLSRVVLAMARRDDMPRGWSAIDGWGNPRTAILVVGVVIGALALIGDVKLTWSLSAFTVLVYYAITNLSALRLPPEARLYPRWIAWVGLLSCLALACMVEPRAWLIGGGLLGLGGIWRLAMRGQRSKRAAELQLQSGAGKQE